MSLSAKSVNEYDFEDCVKMEMRNGVRIGSVRVSVTAFGEQWGLDVIFG